MRNQDSPTPPTPMEIRQARSRLGRLVVETPVWQWRSDEMEAIIGKGSEIFLKLELFQYGGSFKPRGALTVMFDLTKEALDRGVTAVSAGNHAIAVGYAARVLGSTAKVVMPKASNPARIETDPSPVPGLRRGTGRCQHHVPEFQCGQARSHR